MADVFISYKSQDRNFAAALKHRIEDWGYTTWWDQQILGGENFVQVIQSELESAKAVVVLLSKKVVQARIENGDGSYVLAEALFAQPKKPVLPVLIPPLEPEDCPPPFTGKKLLKWGDTEAVHVDLHRHAVNPTNPPKEQTVFRQDVFTTGIPTYTEVDRSRLVEFQDLRANLRMRGRIIRLFGPTQTGKTVMARRALADFMPIEVKGGQVRTLEDFYDAIAIQYAPDIPADSRRLRVLKFLIDSKRPIIVDDFHRVPVSVQEALISDAKDLIESGVNLVLVSIPDCAANIIEPKVEFKNRSIPLKAPRWSVPQLKQIPTKGFAQLKALVHPTVIDELVHQARSNPLLIQEFCYKLCEKMKIFESFATPNPVVIPPSVLTAVFKEVGAARSYDLMPLLNAGDDAIKVRWLDGPRARRLSLAAVLLVVLDRRAGFNELRALTIARHANKLVNSTDRTHVTRESILQAGNDFIKQLEDQDRADTVLGIKEDRFYILHPDFAVYLHWALAPMLTGIQPALTKVMSEYSAQKILKAYGLE